MKRLFQTVAFLSAQSTLGAMEMQLKSWPQRIDSTDLGLLLLLPLPGGLTSFPYCKSRSPRIGAGSWIKNGSRQDSANEGLSDYGPGF